MLTLSIKQLGTNKPLIEKQAISLEYSANKIPLQELIGGIVKKQVDEYNYHQQSQNILRLLATEEIESSIDAGKVSFGKQVDAKLQGKPVLQSYDSALSNALTAFKDGIFCVFVDDVQYESLDDEIPLSDDSEISFIRLTMFTGQRW